MGAVAEVRTPLVGMFFVLRRVLTQARDGYRYAVQGGFAGPAASKRKRSRLAL